MGGWSNGKTPGLQPGDRGSIPRRSTVFWKVAGYASPGRFAKPRDESHVGSNPMPSASLAESLTKQLNGETEIIPRFERGGPGSTPG